jgi:tartrate/fumarate subfamily iron-sulfur-dependent hydro-lyase beta chain
MDKINLKIPLSEKDARNLTCGDIVFLTGVVWTCRSRFHIRVAEEKILPPIDTRAYNVMLHSGPNIGKVDGAWKLRALSITTSIRFEKWEPTVIERLGLRAILGKGRVGKGTLEAMKKFGCVHLIRTGVFSGAYATMVERVKEAHWLDLGGPESLFVLEVKDFGPLIAEADIRGTSLYDQMGKKIDKHIPELYRKLSVEDVFYHEK